MMVCQNFLKQDLLQLRIFLTIIKPYLLLKPRLAALVLQIIDEYSQVQSEADFLKVCQKVDKTAEYTDSKKENTRILQ